MSSSISFLDWVYVMLGPFHCASIYLCLYLCILCFLWFILHSCCITVSTVVWTWWDWSLILRTIFLQCFDAVGWVIWPVKTCPRYDLWCVWWDGKPWWTSTYISEAMQDTMLNYVTVMTGLGVNGVHFSYWNSL